MELTSLLSSDAVFPALKPRSKKALFQELSVRLSDIVGVEPRELFSALLERERLGSTGMGRGVAIPHCRMPGVTRIWGSFARLETPVDFESADGEPVDLIFVLIAPEDAGTQHLRALARVSRILRESDYLAKLRGARDEAALYALLVSSECSKAA